MTSHPSEPFFSLIRVLGEWPEKTLSNWSFAQPEDRIEAKTVESFQHVGTTFWTHAERALNNHMDFVSHRLHEDINYAKSLSQCSAPEQSLTTTQAFYARMVKEYQTYFEKQTALLRDGFSENTAAVEDLSETAIENADELGKATRESLQTSKSASTRSKRSQTSKTAP